MKINNVNFPIGPNGGLITINERPIKSEGYERISLGIKYAFKPAIVMQGLIVDDADFTLETIKLYRKIHPHAIVVLSTWKNYLWTVTLSKIAELGAISIESDPPEWAGQQNMNLQIFSSRVGLEAAKMLGATHAIKTRTDQRLCATDIMEYLLSLQKIYPLQDNKIQNQRLIAISLDTFRYRMYGIGDFFLFGEINDMVTYWSPELDSRKFDDKQIHFKNLREFSEWRICEVYFCTEFLKRTGWELKWTLEDYWKMLVSRFCVIDAISIDLLWPKYSNREFGPWSTYSLQEGGLTELGFRDWTLLYAGIDSIERIPEELLG